VFKKVAGKVIKEKLETSGIERENRSKLLRTGQIEINGKIFYAKDFKEPDLPSSVLFIIDCPNENMIDSLF